MPLAPATADQRTGPRQWRAEKAAAGAALAQQRSASFHGRGTAEREHQHRHDLLRQRPRTHPDLLAGVRERGFRRPGTRGAGSAEACGSGAGKRAWGAGAGGRRAVPSKVLVTVAVQRSMWPLHVMASTEWRVADLVAAAVGLYVREGRRPLLPSADPSAFGLHYSQFSLQSLDPEEKLMELGSRSFFLCPKADAAVTSSSTRPPSEATSDNKPPNMLPPWLGFMHFWPLL